MVTSPSGVLLLYSLFYFQFDVLSMADNAGLDILNMQLPFVNYLTIFYSHLNHFPSCGDKVI